LSASRYITFNLLNNAKDSLRHAVQLLAFNDAANLESQLKHAIVSTAHCVELLLKERLRRIDPAQVLKDPQKYPDLSAYTVTVDVAIERLKTLGNIDISGVDRNAIKNLSTARNAIIHYEWSIASKAAKTIVGEGLSFVFSFSRAELGIDLAKEFQTDDTWRCLIEELNQFTESYREKLAAIMRTRGDDPVECSNCGEEMVPWHGGSCEFCGHWHDFEAEC
jgi:hypothetical protein